MNILPYDYERLRRDAGISRITAIALLLSVWLVPASLASLETYAMAQLNGRDIPFWRAFAAQGIPWFVYGMLSPIVLHATARLPLHVVPRLPKLLTHGAIALLLGLPYAVTATTTFREFISRGSSTRPFMDVAFSWYLSSLPVMLLTYFAVVGAGTAVHWFVRHRDEQLKTAQLEAQLSEARLGALRMQLHPHFLFNSLNAITVLVRDKDHHTAERMLELLAELLRSTLRSGAEHRVPLEAEIAFIRRYLEIEEIRFSDRLRIRYEIDAGLENALVPALVLQPLIENAIRHGISRIRTAGQIGIAARREGARLILEISDDGPGPNANSQHSLVNATREPANTGQDPREQGGVGLANTRSRLAVLYGDATCDLFAAPAGGTIARINLPLEWSQRPTAELVHV